jgi:hypothetical protein
MPTTYSPNLKIAILGTGENVGTWGTMTNDSLGTVIEQAITGWCDIVMTDANYTLSSGNGTEANESRNVVLAVTGTNSVVRDVIVPFINKLYIVYNGTNLGINVCCATGVKTFVRTGETIFVFADGVDTHPGPNHTIIQGSGNCTVTTVGNVTTISVP